MSWPNLVFRVFKFTTLVVGVLTVDHMILDGYVTRQIVTGFEDVRTDPMTLIGRYLPGSLTGH